MAGRPRVYETPADKTRAYRARRQQQIVCINRLDLETLEMHLERLMRAVNGAKDRSETVACSLKTVSRLDLLESLAEHFEAKTDPEHNPGEHRKKH